MYDWLRLDLDGKPRSLNIDRAFDNLYFDRRAGRILDEFISKPILLQEGASWRAWHCPTHREHFYDVHRFEFSSLINVETTGSCNVLSLVEGESVILELEGGLRQRFNYAETFVIPAATQEYRLIREGTKPVKVVKCFVKPSAKWSPGVLA